MTLSGLITNLLDVSRVQAGALAVSCGPVSIADVILPALDELGLGPADVELAVADDLPLILADPGLLQRVLVNFLRMLYGSPRSVVPCECRRADSAARLRFELSIPGRVSPVIVETIFCAIPASGRYRQLHRSWSRPRAVQRIRGGNGRHARSGRHPWWRSHDGDITPCRARGPATAARRGTAVKVKR